MNYRYLSAIAAAALSLGMGFPSTSALSNVAESRPASTAETTKEISQRRYTYEIHLVGIACYRESNHVWGATADEPFVVVNSVDSRGALTDKIFPQGYLHLSKMNQGDVRRFSNTLVWRGPVQRVNVSAQGSRKIINLCLIGVVSGVLILNIMTFSLTKGTSNKRFS